MYMKLTDTLDRRWPHEAAAERTQVAAEPRSFGAPANADLLLRHLRVFAIACARGTPAGDLALGEVLRRWSLTGHPVRVVDRFRDLYRAFEAEPAEPGAGPDGHAETWLGFTGLTRAERAAAVLVVGLTFDVAEAGYVLDETEDRVATLLSGAVARLEHALDREIVGVA